MTMDTKRLSSLEAGTQLSDLGDSATETRSVDEHNASKFNIAERISRQLFHKDRLDRKLKRHHITGIAFSGTVGAGLFVSSGQLIGLSGPLGCVLSYICAGAVIIAVMRSLAEMVSVRPLSGALIDYPHTWVDPALGFAVGVIYCLAQCMSMATLTASAARIANQFSDVTSLNDKQKIGIIIGLYMITLLSNLCGVKLYGRFERVVKWLKLLLIVGLCILMILVKAGVGHKATTQTSKSTSSYGSRSLTPFLRWDGFNEPEDLKDGYRTGISGSWGQFLSIWTSTILAMFSCMGGDLVIITAGEAESPRRDLPPATRFMYMVPIGLYIITSFLLGFNIDFMAPNLPHPWANSPTKISGSPFIIVLKNTTMGVLPGFVNGCFLFSAYTAANTGLYASSRTLFALAQNYGNRVIRETLGRTNDGHTPVAAILFCSTFGLLAFLGLADESFNQPILSLSAFFTGSVACVYGSECIAFLRFKAGLTRLHKDGIFSRDDEVYKRKHYRAHWQPTCALFGLFACIMFVAFSGWPAIYLLSARHTLSTESNLKSNSLLAADVVGAYSGPLLFIILYLGYKICYRTEIRRFADFKDEYFLPEFDAEPSSDKERYGFKWKYVLHEAWSLTK